MLIRTLTVLPHPLLSPPFLFSPQPPTRNPNPNSNTFPSWLTSRRRRLLCLCARGSDPSWDSNAEDVRDGRFGFRDDGEGFFGKKEKRKWWSDESMDEEYDLFDDEPEQPWDMIWIFKVFKSYGFLLPAIIASMLLATGPKAFLMALALPLGQSALSLAFEKVWGRESDRPRPRTKSRKKPYNRYARDFVMQDEDENTEPNQAKQHYRPWVVKNDGAAKKGGKRVGGFGGWDELDGHKELKKEPDWVQPPRATANSATGAQAEKKGKLTRRGRKGDTMPLFLRLLIAVFPFLGSWTKFL